MSARDFVIIGGCMGRISRSAACFLQISENNIEIKALCGIAKAITHNAAGSVSTI